MTDTIPFLRRGQIVWVDLDPARGSEAARTRPVVVVSNNTANAAASNTARIHDFQVLLPAGLTGLAHDSKAQAEQVRSVSVARITGIAGWTTPDLMAAVDDALRLHLML
jgi:mRNA interferase MazF